MTHILGPEVVKYACTCGLLKPISKLYFCKHCLELRCSFCVCHEVDSHFCGKCLENLPSSEARLKKNRCGNCLDCPSCHQQLSVRAATVGPKNPEDPKATPRKVFYLLCLLCHWSSRDVGIPDQPATTGGWPERDNVHMHRLQEVISMYKALVLQEKQQRLEKDKKKQRKYMNYTDRTGITAAMLRKRIGLPETPSPTTKPKPTELPGAVAKNELEGLPEDIFTKPINLTEITTIEQRLMLPDSQPTTTDKFFPIHKQLSTKRSLRCRSCEHNVSKPEYNPTSIKFKIQLFAYYHIPEVRIVTIEPLREGKPAELLLKFINPTQHQTTISFFSLFSIPPKEKPLEPKPEEVEAEVKGEEKSLSSLSSQPSSLLHVRQHSITIDPRPIQESANAEVAIPTSMFILPPRDDAAGYDDSADTHNIQDDTKLVVYRKSNKAVVKLIVTPNAGLPLGKEIVAGFTMQHMYTNTITSQKYDHRLNVFLDLGPLVGSE